MAKGQPGDPMRFTVQHDTLYRYSTPVRLADHLLRLTPRADSGSFDHRLDITPIPTWRRTETDAAGNALTRLGFDGETTEFGISSRIAGHTVPPPPPLPALPPLPWPPAGLPAYLGQDDPQGADPVVAAFSRSLAAEAGGDPARFLQLLTETLYRRTDRQIRTEGNAQTARHTLDSARGACRDLTVLFMAACQAQGIPARFASGYQAHAETVDGGRHLHAWPQVFLPGAGPAFGWRAFDPTHGMAMTDGHVTLAAAAEQRDTMPVEGGFFANGVTATLTFSLRIDTA